MAASRCMCLAGRSMINRGLSIAHLQFSRKLTCRSVLVNSVWVNRTFCRRFSAENTKTTPDSAGVKNLTQQILQTKIDDASKSSQEKGPEKDKSSGGNQEEKKSAYFSRRAMKITLYGFGVMFSGIAGYLVAVKGAPPTDDTGNPVKDEFSEMPTWKAYLLRTWKEVVLYNKLIKEPSREKLLPDPLTEPYYQPPYTLVLEMTGVLVHPDWTYKTGWRFKKRPGVDYFLQQIGPPLFEVVIYTSEQGFTAFPIIDSLDRNGYIMYRLFRDATRYLDGHHVKDLACLNRDLSKVIIVDWNEKSVQLQPENAVRIKKWSGNDDDISLVDLAMFLRTIAMNGVDDVRPVLEFYKQYDDPLEAFKVNQRRLQEEQEKASKVKTEIERGANSLTSGWAQGLLRRR